ncbi:MaoC/PaaZ C-terminal domain-containing protein [Microbacterium sp. NPDC096154]|uniref:MaoC/PaaZ C-terminal domain-containing protein n=1 Tax=Microbacterium sp. NPDC096154 TaxID=3155549 RepID=UPI003333FF51
MTQRRVVTLPTLPSLGGLYAGAVASSARIAASRAARGGGAAPVLPGTEVRVAGVGTGGMAAHLRDYQRVVREPASDVLPAGFLHALAFPLSMAVMTRRDFPLPPLGMVHIANDVAVSRPVLLGDELEVRAWAENLRPHRRGVTADFTAEIRVAGELAWRGVSTYLAKGVSTGERAPERAEESAWSPPLPTGRWALPAHTGRAYGAVSGDRNPIHMSALAARAFGFPCAIAHGMYTAARALAEVGPARGESFRWTVEFAKPVLLPGTVDVAITRTGEGFAFAGWNGRRGTKHFAGAVTPP